MKLSAVFGQRDVMIGTTITEAVCRVVPDRKAADIRDVVLGSMKQGIQDWEDRLLPDMYGSDKAEEIRKKLKELRELTVD
jgi:hypothetical protein